VFTFLLDLFAWKVRRPPGAIFERIFGLAISVISNPKCPILDACRPIPFAGDSKIG
jgi:hypothetical protein